MAATPPATQTPHVAVIGGGVVGMASAWGLARRGWRVSLYEALDEVGCGTSFANGAQLSFAYTDALASPATRRQMPSLLLGLNPAFRVSLGIDPEQWLWSLRFLRETGRTAFERNTLTGLELGLESHLALHQLLARHPIDFAHTAPGKLHVHSDPASFAAAARLAGIKHQHGARQTALSPQEALAIEPALAAQMPSMAGAIHSPGEEVGDPHKFCTAMAALLADQYGVAIHRRARIENLVPAREEMRLELADGRIETADHVLVCTGSVPGFLADDRSLRGRIQPMKGYSFTAPPGPQAPAVSITDVARKIVFCRLGSAIRVAGLAEFGKRSAEVDPRRSAYLVDVARQSLPEAADYEQAGAHWAGLRPATPNSLPIIRRLAPRVTVNIGHGMLGWTYSMGAAERAAALIAKVVTP